MDHHNAPSLAGRSGLLFSRRAALRWLGTAVGAAGLGSASPITRFAAAQDGGATPAATRAPSNGLSADLVRAFEDDVHAALATFKVPGAAVALVQGDQVVYARGFGVGDLQRGRAVTERTRFRIASNTKSMTSLLVATFVDQGVLGWDTRVVDLWPEFRAPTAELTDGLRVRDLMGMGSGIGESPTIEFFMMGGGDSALDLLRSVAHLPVIAAANAEYYYNNTLFCVAGYLGPLIQGTRQEGLEEAYARLVAERVFAPIGMADAAIADDPRRLGDDYAVGHTRDLFGRLSAVPFVSINGVAPAGAGLASATGMARYLLTQMNGGVAPEGTRVVSAANLVATHRPGIAVPPDALNALPAVLLPDTTEMRYCLGWFDQTFTDGRHLLWHAGGIDGFASLMGFFPADRLGFVLLTNLEPGRGGSLFNFAVQSSLLSRLFGLNRDLPGVLAGAVPKLEEQMAQLVATTRPVAPDAVRPYLGLYSNALRLRLDDAGVFRLDHDLRSMPLLALPEGHYVVADGPSVILGRTVRFTTDQGGAPHDVDRRLRPRQMADGRLDSPACEHGENFDRRRHRSPPRAGGGESCAIERSAGPASRSRSWCSAAAGSAAS